jgi:hypothetical protein
MVASDVVADTDAAVATGEQAHVNLDLDLDNHLPDPMQEYSRSLYQFTMGLYNAAQRSKVKKSYSCAYQPGEWR